MMKKVYLPATHWERGLEKHSGIFFHQEECRAFSLVEVVMALGVVAFAIVAVMGLLPVGLREARNSTAEVQAVNLMTLLVADLKNATARGGATSSMGLSPTPAASGVSVATIHTFYTDAAQGLTTTRSADSLYRVTLRYNRLDSLTGTEAFLMVSWPPMTDPLSGSTRPMGQVETYLSIPPL